MQPRDFTYWLQGFFEIYDAMGGGDKYPLSADQVQVIRDHLKLVLTKVTPERSGGLLEGVFTKGQGLDVTLCSKDADLIKEGTKGTFSEAALKKLFKGDLPEPPIITPELAKKLAEEGAQLVKKFREERTDHSQKRHTKTPVRGSWTDTGRAKARIC